MIVILGQLGYYVFGKANVTMMGVNPRQYPHVD
jgi:hypothetical protein